ncbi:MAG: hypothetical protein M3321_10440 [Actinomycetota bacterium]|nr:hypothetical protein [Actinomycetota bacterium]
MNVRKLGAGVFAVVALVAVMVSAVAVAATRTGDGTAGTSSIHDHQSHAGAMSAGAAQRCNTRAAANLRVTLDRLLGEHALLAIAATQRGLQGGKEFPAIAAKLDENSVQLGNAIGSVYGRAARNQFLNGPFMWRAHIRFFVDYTTAKAKNDAAGQRRAVGNLRTYVGATSNFFAKATGLPQRALAASITTHVMQLKGQLDAFATGNYARSYRLSRAAYAHMFMTGDALSGAIAQKFPRKFGC